MGEFEFKTLGEVSIWANTMQKAFEDFRDDFRKTSRAVILGIFGTMGATLLEILLKANHLI